MKTRPFIKQTKFLQLGALMLMIVIMNACYFDADYFPCVRAEGEPVSEARISAAAFEGVDLAMHGEVHITRGQASSIVVSAPANILPYVRTRVVGGTLLIDTDRCVRNRINEVQVYITMPSLNTIRVAGSGKITTQDTWNVNNLSIDISGSGSVSGKFDGDQINTRISGSGNAILTGNTLVHNVIISGSGQVSGYDLICENADIRISGSGHAYVFVSNNINGKISGSGNIYFKGNPNIRVGVSGSGKLLRR